MDQARIDRRTLLRGSLLAAALPLLAACGSASPAAPTAAPPASAASPANSPVPAATAAATGSKVSLSFASQDGDVMNWQREFAKRWQAAHPEVDLRVDVVPYNDMLTKTLTGYAAGTLQDVVYVACKWFQQPAYKGAFYRLDDLVKSTNTSLDDFLPAAVANATFEGKLFAFPSYDSEGGNENVVVYNKDILASKGLTPPTDAWTTQDLTDLAVKGTDPANKIFGTDYVPGSFYDYGGLARTFGTDVFSPDGKKFLLATDPKSTQAAQWTTDLHVKYNVAPPVQPGQDYGQGVGFPSGKLATSTIQSNDVLSTGDQIGNKFKWDVVLWPKGPTGLRGFYAWSISMAVYAKSKAPDKAFDLITMESSKEAGIYAVTNSHFSPSPRKSVWTDPAITGIHPIFARVYEWMTEPESQTGPQAFPQPYNLRFAELQTTYANTSRALFYGTAPFADALKQVQDACQAIMDKPRP